LSFLELANWEIGLSGRERHQPRKCERLWTPPNFARNLGQRGLVQSQMWFAEQTARDIQINVSARVEACVELVHEMGVAL
jgi:hypothetical protein